MDKMEEMDEIPKFIEENASKFNLDCKSLNNLMFKKLMSDSEWQHILENYRHFDVNNVNDKFEFIPKSCKQVIRCVDESESKNNEIIDISNETYCKLCDKDFASKYTLILHNKTVHLKIKAFACDVKGCGRRFSQKQAMIFHRQRKHLKNTLLVCNVRNCGKHFRKKSTLILHKEKVHPTSGQFFCDVDSCHKWFVRKETLNLHKETGHQLKRQKLFVCDHRNCGKSFAQKHSLISHKSYVHRKDRAVQCNEQSCGKFFKSKQGLKLHFKSQHWKTQASNPGVDESGNKSTVTKKPKKYSKIIQKD